MKSIRKLWWLGAVAVIAACDPYDDERGGTPEILSVFGSVGDDFVDAEGDATTGYTITTPSACVPADAEEGTEQHVDPLMPVIFVKFNKLLDGASIQATPESCAPANDWLSVARNGAPDTGDWFSCYNPSSPTASESASITLYRGEDVSTGVAGDGWLSVASGAGSATEVSTYVLTGNVQDKQGNAIPINITYVVQPDAGEVDVTVAAGVLTWDAAACGSATAYNVYKQDATDEAPVLLTAAPITETTYTDATFVAEREYFVAPVIGTVETELQGPFSE